MCECATVQLCDGVCVHVRACMCRVGWGAGSGWTRSHTAHTSMVCLEGLKENNWCGNRRRRRSQSARAIVRPGARRVQAAVQGWRHSREHARRRDKA